MSVEALLNQQTEAKAEPVDCSRRLMLYVVSTEQLHEILTGHMCCTAIPEDAKLISVFSDYFSDNVLLKYSHPTFSEIESGYMIPQRNPMITMRLEPEVADEQPGTDS